MSQADSGTSCVEPMSRITGFEVAASAQSSPASGTPVQLMRRAPSALSLGLQGSSYGSSKLYESESEAAGHSSDEFSDYEEEELRASPKAIPIIQK